jgi:hypothetical protein
MKTDDGETMRKLIMGSAVLALTAIMGTGTAEAATVAPAVPATARPSGQDVWWMKTNAQTNRPRGLWQGSPCPRAATPS